jgi:hypothetical protein
MRTHSSCYPRVSVGFAVIQSLKFIFGAVAPEMCGQAEPGHAKGQCYRRWRVTRSHSLTDCSTVAIQSRGDDPIFNDAEIA